MCCSSVNLCGNLEHAILDRVFGSAESVLFSRKLSCSVCVLCAPDPLQQCQESEVPLQVPTGELSQVQVQLLQPAVSQAEAQELRKVSTTTHSLPLRAERSNATETKTCLAASSFPSLKNAVFVLFSYLVALYIGEHMAYW